MVAVTPFFPLCLLDYQQNTDGKKYRANTYWRITVLSLFKDLKISLQSVNTISKYTWFP
jgi:hypothetical protein